MEFFLFYLIGLTAVSFLTIFIIDQEGDEKKYPEESTSSVNSDAFSNNQADGQIIRMNASRHDKSSYSSPQPRKTLHREISHRK